MAKNLSLLEDIILKEYKEYKRLMQRTGTCRGGWWVVGGGKRSNISTMISKKSLKAGTQTATEIKSGTTKSLIVTLTFPFVASALPPRSPGSHPSLVGPRKAPATPHSPIYKNKKPKNANEIEKR